MSDVAWWWNRRIIEDIRRIVPNAPVFDDQLVDAIREMAESLRWRPISELHEDFGDCVLVNINDPGYMRVGSNLDVDFDLSLWTHFSRIAPMSHKDGERMKAEVAGG